MQKLVLFWAIFASIAAAIFALFALVMFQQSRVQRVGPGQSMGGSSKGVTPWPPEAYTTQGLVMVFRTHQLASAIAILEECIRQYPDYAEAYHGLATAQRDAGEPALAMHNHDRAIELDPKRPDFYWERGLTCQRLKDHDAAIATFEMGLPYKDLDAPRSYYAPGNLHVGLAGSYRAKGDLQRALEHNEQAIALNPHSDWFYRERGYTYQAMGDQERAEADFAMARELKNRPR